MNCVATEQNRVFRASALSGALFYLRLKKYDIIKYNNQEINIEELYNFPTYIIRIIGRAYGVKSPTTKPNKQIVDEIKQIINGEMQPCTKVLGRKPKNTNLGNEIISFTNIYQQKREYFKEDLNKLMHYKMQTLKLVTKLYDLIDDLNKIINEIDIK